MADKSKIEWTDASWTPIRARLTNREQAINKPVGAVGWHCEHDSEGCRFCYAEAMNKRLGTGLDFKPGHRKDIEVFLDEKMLTAPLHWRDPRKVFVCSMTDLFADFVKDEWIDRMFAVIALCPQHTFQILTKRPERMRAYMAALIEGSRCIGKSAHELPVWSCEKQADEKSDIVIDKIVKPLPNVWLGTSCEDQAAADARIPHLLATPAAIRFLSCEPLLGPIDLRRLRGSPPGWNYDALFGQNWCIADDGERLGGYRRGKVDWVIAGGESGRAARPMHPDWPRSLRDQCAAARVPFFFKQWGEWSPYGCTGDRARTTFVCPTTGEEIAEHDCAARDDDLMFRLGKAKAGRTLDGKTHDDMPEVA